MATLTPPARSTSPRTGPGAPARPGGPARGLARPAGAVAAAVTTIAWGGQFVVGRAAFAHVHPVWVTALRYAVAGLALAGILAWREGRAAFRWDRDVARAWLLGTVGFAGFNLLAYVGLAHTRPENASLVVTTMPLVTAFVLWARTGARPSRPTAVAALVALAGVAVVLTDGDPLALVHGGLRGGDLLVLAGVVAWVVYTTGAASLPGWSPLRYTGVTALGGSVSILVIAAGLSAAGLVPVPGPGAVAAIGWQLAYLIVPGAVVAMLTWTAAVRSLGAQDATLFINLVPVTTFAVEAVLGHRPSAAQLAGAGVVVAAVVGSNLLGRRTARAPRPTVAVETCTATS